MLENALNSRGRILVGMAAATTSHPGIFTAKHWMNQNSLAVAKTACSANDLAINTLPIRPAVSRQR